ncbi:hypothetical protein JW835_15900 [bacterium]|nr:hypothetical protein [bacterium]
MKKTAIIIAVILLVVTIFYYWQYKQRKMQVETISQEFEKLRANPAINDTSRIIQIIYEGEKLSLSFLPNAIELLDSLRIEAEWLKVKTKVLEDTITNKYKVNLLEEFSKIDTEKIHKFETDSLIYDIKMEEDWEKANQLNTIQSYLIFIKKYPESIYAKDAGKKITLLEFEDKTKSARESNFLGEPVAQHDRCYAILNIHNDTKYELSIWFVGVDTFKIVYQSDEKASIEVINGEYTVTASVEAPNVKNYFDVQTFNGGDFEIEFYVSFIPKMQQRNPFWTFKQWEPIKRKVSCTD